MQEQKLALRCGLKPVTSIEGQGDPKIGIEELMAVVRRFGFSEETLETIRRAVEAEDMGEGPFLVNYYSDLEETCVQAFEGTAQAHFCGYYDKTPWDATGRCLPGLEVDLPDGPPAPGDEAVVGLIDTENDCSWQALDSTHAWHWQLGAMLQWTRHDPERSVVCKADGNRRADIDRFYAPPELDGPIRCDLHPRWNRDGTKVCIDSLHEGSRQIYVLDVSDITEGN